MKQHVKPYSHGYICDGAGTIMAYAEKTALFYSSPHITLNGVRCGEENIADNARAVREFYEAKFNKKRLINS